MKYNIIGTGNTAWFMATKLAKAGHQCLCVYGRNILRARELADRIGSCAYELDNGINDDADVCIIAVSDHAIADVCSKLNLNRTIVIHTAGAVDMAILSKFGAGYGVIWPVYSIVKNNIPTERNIPTVWESSNNDTADYIKTITASYTDITHQADSQQRKWLHLSAVLSNNFSNHLFAISEKLCEEQQLPFSLLLPIIQQTVSRLHSLTAFSQQTGPAKRNDELVLQSQITMLQSHPDWQILYDAISTSIKNMYPKP
jgi:hypothetical protein